MYFFEKSPLVSLGASFASSFKALSNSLRIIFRIVVSGMDINTMSSFITLDFHLYSFDFKDTRLEKVRDLFCFQCFTGMAYTDMVSFKKLRIRDGCIYYQRVKTGDSPEVMVPISGWTQSILDRYDELPVISNQKYNDFLKEMAEEAGFTNKLIIKRFYGGEAYEEESPKYEKITSHVGRKTCASVSADLGLERTVTKKILGHDNKEVHDSYRDERDYVRKRFLEVWSKENIEKVILN